MRARRLTDAADPQCGLKAFRRETAQLLFGLTTIDDFAFDVEIFYLARLYGFDVKFEPVRVLRAGHTSVNLLTDVPRMLASLAEIKRADRDGRYAPTDPARRAALRPRQAT